MRILKFRLIKKSFFKPSFIPEKIDEIIAGKNILHIIEERDR